jgi:hypothetical protein
MIRWTPVVRAPEPVLLTAWALNTRSRPRFAPFTLNNVKRPLV